MRRVLMAWLLGSFAAASGLVVLPTETAAQTRCPEGRTAGGECVSASLAWTMRQMGIIFSQPKISQTAYPVLPAEDRLYRYPNQLNPDPLKPPPVAGPGVP
jgi:hypothetical protein